MYSISRLGIGENFSHQSMYTGPVVQNTYFNFIS